MTGGEVLIVAFVVAVFVVMMAGFPVALSLAGTSLAFAVIGSELGQFNLVFLGFIPNRIYGFMTNEVLVAVPLFVFMGIMLERSKVAEELLDSMGQLFGNVRGGLGISVCLVGALLAASTGIVGATVVTMGLISLPTMLRWNYSQSVSCGVIAASGTLGQIIPPSILLVILGDVISNAHVEAQRAKGNLAPDPVSVGDLFAGALIPGLLLVGLYILYLLSIAWLRPETSPAVPRTAIEDVASPTQRSSTLAGALVAPIVLIVAVLGSILGGIATPTEAASVGAVGAILLGALKAVNRSKWPIHVAGSSIIGLFLLTSVMDLRVARESISTFEMAGIMLATLLCAGTVVGTLICLTRSWSDGVLGHVMRSTAMISSMIFTIIIGAQIFSLVFRGLGGDEFVHGFLTSLPGERYGALIFSMALIFCLGFLLDTIEITYVVVPIVAPVLLLMDIDPIWLGILIALNLQTSFLTPPFGFALFYLRGVAPNIVATGQIYRGVAPFIGMQVTAICILGVFPALALWLPELIFGQ